MKKKIFITLAVYSLVFLLGGIYIITTIETSTSKLNNLIELYQVESRRKELLISINDVQTVLNLRKTPHAKSIETIIANVRSMKNLAGTCFKCHHSEGVVKKLNNLRRVIEQYKDLISRILTIRSNRERLSIEEEKAFFVGEQLLLDVKTMVHLATAKLSEKTQSSLSDISESNIILFALVGITPIFAIALGLIFIKGITGPVNVLLMATRKIEGGNLEYRIDGLKDEFGEVAASFNEMATRVEEYTKRLERQALELERAHREMSTFCQVLKQIGGQQTLDGVGSFLMKELQNFLDSRHMILYVFSSDRNTLFTLSEDKTSVINKQELVQTASTLFEDLDGLTISPKIAFKPPLLPDYFPVDGQQTIIPLRIQDYTDGAFVVVCAPGQVCDEMQLDLIALILEQASGTIKRAVLHEERIRLLENQIETISGFGGIIGKDPKMKLVYKLIEDIAPTDATVLIQGETGTGKEMVARAIRKQSLRKDKPFVVINCSAYPSTLLESELFGHEKGAFTGAIRQKIGRFEQADGGTVFLDEIGEIPLSAQVKLLRVLQARQFERLGGELPVSVNVRILAATHKDLLEEVNKGNFREDLYYRINVIPIQIPPLKSRRNDIPLLAQYFQRRFASKHGEDVRGFSTEAMRRLLDYSWPGNVRELENTIEHAVVLSKGGQIEISHLPSVLFSDMDTSPSAPTVSHGTILDNEKMLLEKVLEECNWNKSRAALRLGISRSTLYDKLKKYRIVKSSVQ